MPHDVKFLLVGIRCGDGSVRPFKEPQVLRHMRPNPEDWIVYVRPDGRPIDAADVEAVCRCKKCRAGLVHRNDELRALTATRIVEHLN